MYRLASALHKFGVKVGDRVATFMWNNGRHYQAYHAVPSMGAVLHTLNIRLGSADLSYIINHADDCVVFIDADLLSAVERVRKQYSRSVVARFSRGLTCTFLSSL